MSPDRRYHPSRRSFLAGLAGLATSFGVAGQQLSSAPRQPAVAQDPFPGKKKILAIGDVHTGYQHDSVSHALATIERLGRQSGDFITYIRTDTQLITKGTSTAPGDTPHRPQELDEPMRRTLTTSMPSSSSGSAKRSSPRSRRLIFSHSFMTTAKVSSARTPPSTPSTTGPSMER